METYHVYTAKRKVLLDINEDYKYEANGDFFKMSIMVFKHKGDHFAQQPTTYEELEGLLKDYDKVYDYYKVDTGRHGEIGYDIILEE